MIFFTSELGKLVLKSLYLGSTIPRLAKVDLQQIQLPVPTLNEQSMIVRADARLVALYETVDELRKELSLNPKGAVKVFERVVDIDEELNLFSYEGKVNAVIRAGESKTVEFKETFSVDVRKGSKEKYIEKASLKTIVAFLNSDGGILLIGVQDIGKVIGIQDEIQKYHKNDDKFLLHFKNALKAKIGEEYYPCIDYELIRIDQATVFIVNCKPSSKPCFLDEKEFYVRTNPATDMLEGRKMAEYISVRFR